MRPPGPLDTLRSGSTQSQGCSGYMQATARFVMDRPYFEEAFSEWLAHRSRFKRFQRQLGATMFGLGLLVVLLSTELRLPGAIFAALGLVEWAEFYWYRARWIEKRLAVRGSEPSSIEMTFDESGIHTSGPTASGHIQWQGVHELLRTKRGMFIRLGDSMSVYVSASSVTPSLEVVLRLSTLTERAP